jgi:hypothetical protein
MASLFTEVHEMDKQKLFNIEEHSLPLIYRGLVEDVNDPAKAGRVRIRILGIHSDNHAYVKTDTLPWAIPATSIGLLGGGLRNIGSYKVPDIGSHVYVFFEAGDHNFPIYFAASPAIEYIESYEEKDGKLKGTEYEYKDSSRHDDRTNYSEQEDQSETPGAESEIDENKQVQDWCPQTRKNTFSELENPPTTMDPPGYKKVDPQEIFPKNFFQKEIRIAFDGAANHDAPGYHGIEQTKASTTLTKQQERAELDEWAERKFGFNDDDPEHQHDWKGGKDWKPEYPMCSTERNAQGEIIDTDILKERKTYVHPSKYFIELVQLDASRKKDDFLNERSIKNVYERQRGVGNSPTGDGEDGSDPKKIQKQGDSNLPDAILTRGDSWQGRGNNKIKYDDIDGGTREQVNKRFEERKHNPGREKTIIEDFVYRFYMNKVNETYLTDRNIRFYRGNDNLEIEHGDVNQRFHRGSNNFHIDEGNYNRTINKGWHHTHIDEGHQFVEIAGQNPFEQSDNPEPDGNPYRCVNQHFSTNVPNGAIGEGCDAKFQKWPFAQGENECGNQFYLLHKGHQIFRLENGHQHFQLNKGHQKFWLKEGHQTYHLMQGDQRFQLDNGHIERVINGKRTTKYNMKCKEITDASWQFVAGSFFKVVAPTIVLQGNVRITGDVQIDGNVKCGVIDSPGSPNMKVKEAVKCEKIEPPVILPSGTANVSNPDDPDTISPDQCQ